MKLEYFHYLLEVHRHLSENVRGCGTDKYGGGILKAYSSIVYQHRRKNGDSAPGSYLSIRGARKRNQYADAGQRHGAQYAVGSECE